MLKKGSLDKNKGPFLLLLLHYVHFKNQRNSEDPGLCTVAR